MDERSTTSTSVAERGGAAAVATAGGKSVAGLEYKQPHQQAHDDVPAFSNNNLPDYMNGLWSATTIQDSGSSNNNVGVFSATGTALPSTAVKPSDLLSNDPLELIANLGLGLPEAEPNTHPLDPLSFASARHSWPNPQFDQASIMQAVCDLDLAGQEQQQSSNNNRDSSFFAPGNSQNDNYSQNSTPIHSPYATPSIPEDIPAGLSLPFLPQPQQPQQHQQQTQQQQQQQQQSQPQQAIRPSLAPLPLTPLRQRPSLQPSLSAHTIQERRKSTGEDLLRMPRRRSHTSVASVVSLSAHDPVCETRNGIEYITFLYSQDRLVRQYTVRTDIESIPPGGIPDDFCRLNAIYPRAHCAREHYDGNRWAYETSCNDLGWKIAWLNRDVLEGKRGLIQRAVDAYRNRHPTMRSRRVSRQEKVANGTLRRRRHSRQPSIAR